MAELRKSFRPEFLNRIDETILFKPLTHEEITTSVDLLLAELNPEATQKPGLLLRPSGPWWRA